MKKIIIIITFIFSFIIKANAGYILENDSQKLVNTYNFSTKNLEKSITRKEFVETLSVWYVDYMKGKKKKVNFEKYKKIDNTKYFLDVDLTSDFWKKLSFFVDKKWFTLSNNFNPNALVDTKTFFIVLKNLWILSNIESCKTLYICMPEFNDKMLFSRWTYYKIVSRILYKDLRINFKTPKQFLDNWYKSFLSSNYSFPLKKQTQNWCYAFAARNLVKYKFNKDIDVPKIEKLINKPGEKLWDTTFKTAFNNEAWVIPIEYYNISTLFHYLQLWHPINVTYVFDYTDKYWKPKQVNHIVTAYSFDQNWVWVAETVKNKYVLLPYDKIFNENGKVKIARMYDYIIKK